MVEAGDQTVVFQPPVIFKPLDTIRISEEYEYWCAFDLYSHIT